MNEPEVWIGVVLLVVVLGGFVVLSERDSLTAMVVVDSCDCAPGASVCGAIGSHVQDYSSACHAVCAGARVVFEDRCGYIPLA